MDLHKERYHLPLIPLHNEPEEQHHMAESNFHANPTNAESFHVLLRILQHGVNCQYPKYALFDESSTVMLIDENVDKIGQ